MDEAIRHLHDAVRLDPLSLTANLILAFGLYSAGHLDEGRRQCAAVLDLEPDFVRAAMLDALILLRQGKAQEAVARAKTSAAVSDEFAPSRALAACVFACAGDPDAAHCYADSRLSYWTAMVYACLRQKNKAFRYLNEALRERDPWLVCAPYESLANPLRGDRRFRLLLDQLKLRELSEMGSRARA
jgi:hypothetical protein